MDGEERHRRVAERASLVYAAREHSKAVSDHLDRVARGLRARPIAQAGSPETRGAARVRDVRGDIDALSRLLLADRSPGRLLDAVVDLARRTVDACDGASLTLVEAGRPYTAASTDPRAERSDRCQYDVQEGPCWEAATTGRAVLADVLPDPRWPRFSVCPGAQGWGGLLSVPLAAGAGVVGALNLFASPPGALVPEHTRIAAQLAEHAGVAVARARDLRDQGAVAQTYQRFLLPASLPVVPGLALAARYQPASAGSTWVATGTTRSRRGRAP